jgi:hypothetical protein
MNFQKQIFEDIKSAEKGYRYKGNLKRKREEDNKSLPSLYRKFG